MSRQLERITERSRLEELAEPWDRLAFAEATPFGCHGWFSSWWAAFGAGTELSIDAHWDGDELSALLPLSQRNGHLHALANEHTPVFHPPSRDLESLRALVDPVMANPAARLEAPAMGADDPALELLVESSRAARRLTLVERQHTAPIVDTGGDYEAYRQEIKHRLGAPLDRFRRKATRDYDASFVFVEPPADLELELRRGFELEASGWKGRAATAILSSPETELFYRGVAEAFHAAGELRLSRIDLDGKPAAFDFSILHANRLFLIKTAYDESHRKLAPGLVLRLGIIERCFELGLEAHELLGDAEPWKLKFSTSERETRTLRSYPRRPAEATRYAYRRALRPALKLMRSRARSVRDSSS